MKKRCGRCGKEKDLGEFHIDRSRKDGHKSVCRACLSRKRRKNSGVDKNIKQSLRYCLKSGGPFRWSSILGYSKEELLAHLEKELLPGMDFSNYGSVWGVTFHIPRSCYSFSSLRDEDFRKCWSLKNLKPDYIESCRRQRQKISRRELDEFHLYDILPSGNIQRFLED